MVRLKAAVSTSGDEFTIFQFHYGTIKSEYASFLEPSVKVFQFHYGTIKSLNIRMRFCL